jgi:PST family polysaccharide transporter
LKSIRDIRRLAPRAGNLLADRIFRAILELAVGLWMARYLGPANFGDLSFAIAVVALLGPFATVGLQGVLVRELVAHPDEASEILGSAATIRLVGACIVVVILLVGSEFFVGGARLSLVQIVAIGVLFQVSEILDLYLQALGQMRASAVARSSAAAVASALRVGLILTMAGVFAFAWAFTAEMLLWAAFLSITYRLGRGTGSRWRWSSNHARRLLTRSWPLILSGVGAVLNLKIDQVMLGAMVSPGELGHYSAAARLSEAAYFLPLVLVTAAFPGIVRARENDPADYLDRLDGLVRLLVGLAWCIIVAGLLLGPGLIRLTLGDTFAAAVPVFRVHIFACLFIFPGVVLSRWLIAEDLTRFSITRHAAGGLVNVALNLALIPVYGGFGAAVATVISYAVASHFSFYISRETRPAATIVTRALFVLPRPKEGHRP